MLYRHTEFKFFLYARQSVNRGTSFSWIDEVAGVYGIECILQNVIISALLFGNELIIWKWYM